MKYIVIMRKKDVFYSILFLRYKMSQIFKKKVHKKSQTTFRLKNSLALER